ncbi:MAG: YdcF family protein [Actinomycetota bacterium]|nr:YdcF family protein [Actinomycetota bacterium]
MTGSTVARVAGRYLAGFVVLSVVIVAGIVIRTVQVGGRDDRDRVDAIVVLGAAQYNGKPSPVYQARLDHARELFRAGVADHIVTLGGGQPGDRTTEGASGLEYLAGKGIARADLISVDVGSDTLASLRAAADVINEKAWHTVVLVTDPAHAFRASTMAADLGFAVTLSSVRQGPATASDIQLKYYSRETLGSLFYLLTGGSSHAGSTVL